MRILFVSANPRAPDQARKFQELRVQHDIAQLQHAATAAGRHITLIFLPTMTVGELPTKLLQIKPDVLHISTHGEKDSLALTNDEGRAVAVSAEKKRWGICLAKSNRLD